MVQVYGIANCDTVKKAITWLKENNISFAFHDFKREGITTIKLKEWLQIASLDQVLNKKSIAFKNLSMVEKQHTTINAEAIKLMQINTNLIKRPVIETAGIILNGFNEDEFQKILGKK